MTSALLELAIAVTYVLSVVLLSALVIAIAYLVRTTPPLRYRCADCSAELPTWDLLLAHESEHHPATLCARCGADHGSTPCPHWNTRRTS